MLGRDVPLHPLVVLLGRLLLEPHDHICAQALHLISHESLECFCEITRRDAFGVQSWDQLLDRRAPSEIRRQHARRESDAVLFVRRLIPHQGLRYHQTSGSGEDFPGRQVSIPNHLAATGLVAAISMLGEEGIKASTSASMAACNIRWASVRASSSSGLRAPKFARHSNTSVSRGASR